MSIDTLQGERQVNTRETETTKTAETTAKAETATLFPVLPLDVLLLIVDPLCLLEIWKIAQTAKLIYRRLWGSPTLWKRLYRRDISEVMTEPAKKNLDAPLEAPHMDERVDPEADQKYREAYRRVMIDLGTQHQGHPCQYAAESGYERLLNRLLDRENRKFGELYIRTLLDSVMAAAASKGRLNIVNDIIARGAVGLSWAMARAAFGGHLDTVLVLLQRLSDPGELMNGNRCVAMVYAAKGGHLEIVRVMIAKGATNWDESLIAAACSGHLDVVLAMITGDGHSERATNLPTALTGAAKNGHLNVVTKLTEVCKFDAAYIEHALLNAQISKRLEVAKYLQSIQLIPPINRQERRCEIDIALPTLRFP